jgi:hypothetical protein
VRVVEAGVIEVGVVETRVFEVGIIKVSSIFVAVVVLQLSTTDSVLLILIRRIPFDVGQLARGLGGILNVDIFLEVIAFSYEVDVLASETFVDGEAGLLHQLLEAALEVHGINAAARLVLDGLGDHGPLGFVELFFDVLLGVEKVEVIFVTHVDECSLESFVTVGKGRVAVLDASGLEVGGLALGPRTASLGRGLSEKKCGQEKSTNLHREW